MARLSYPAVLRKDEDGRFVVRFPDFAGAVTDGKDQEEALNEAALQNKRSWRYAAAILQRWATEGRKRETAGRDPGEGNSARAQLLRRFRDAGGG